MSSNLHYNILNTKTVLRKDTILKIITNTLLIATLFTSSIIASQGCTGGACMATFGKQAEPKVIATDISFKPDVVENSISTVTQPSYIETQNIINIVEERSYVEESSFTEIVVSEEEIITPQFEPTIIPEETIEYLEIATILEDETLNTKPYCEEYQGVLSCDITGDTSECICV